MTQETLTFEPRLLDEAHQGPPDDGRSLVPSDPWTAGWNPPSRAELSRKHALALKRERQLARTGHDGADLFDIDALEAEQQAGADARGDVHSPMAARPPRSRQVLGAVAAVATAYWYYALTTVVIAIAIPLAAGWDASTVVTGSMEPVISPGDVVAFADPDGTDLAPGTVVQFQDPSHPGQTVTHRIVGQNPDGSYVTKGDANRDPDSTPVPPDSIIGIARLVTPNAGLPQLWFMRGDTLLLVGWAGLTIASIAIMSAHSSDESRRERPRPGPRRRRSILRPAVAIGLVAALAGIGTAAWTNGRFAAATGPAENTFQAAVSPFQHIAALGTVSCQATQSTITMSGSVAAGGTVIIRFALRDLQGGAGYSATDSAGNTYSVDAIASDGPRTEVAILSGYVATALSAGDQITLTHPDGRASSASFEVFTGIAATAPVVGVGSGTGNDQIPSVTVTPSEVPVLAVGQLAVRDLATVTIPAPGWDPLQSGTVQCNRTLTASGEFLKQSITGPITYAPTLDAKNRWSGVVVTYRSG